MKYAFGVIIVLSLFLIQIPAVIGNSDELNIYSPKYFEQQDNVLETINYLENEPLAFEICSNEIEDVSATYTCKDSTEEIDLFTTTADNNVCHFRTKSFEDIECDDFTLEISFQENNRERVITRTFSKQKESSTLTNVLNKNRDDMNSLDLSYFLALHSSVIGEDNQIRTDTYEKLRNERDNSKKCWPSGDCNLEKTAKILYNTYLAGFDLNSRILQDGKIYLESLIQRDSSINYDETSITLSSMDAFIEFRHDFSNGDEITCDIITDGVTDLDRTFDNTSTLEDFIIKTSIDSELELDCDEDVDEIEVILSQSNVNSGERTNENRISRSISNFNQNQFGNFDLRLQIEHEFTSDQEISCDLIIDDDEQTTYNFDDSSSSNEFLIEKSLSEEFEFDCDTDLDFITFSIFAGERIETQGSNEKNLSINTNEFIGDKFNFEIHLDYDLSSNDLTCELTLDSNSKRTYHFSQGDDLIIEGPRISSSANLQCDNRVEQIESFVVDRFGRKQEQKKEELTTSHNINIPNDFSRYECIGEGGECYEEATLLALTIYDDFDTSSRLQNYVSSLKQRNASFPLISSENSVKNSGQFLLYQQDETLISSLRFLQNNEGSWGSGEISDKLVKTSWATLGLEQHDGSNEHLKDAKEWIYTQEPNQGWDSIELNSLAYLAIEDRVKPYLKINPIDQVSGKTVVTIENPTIFSLKNVEVGFSNNLDSALKYKEDLGTIEQNDKLNFTIEPLDNLEQSYFGEMTITGLSNNEEHDLVTIPISIEENLPYSIRNNQIFFAEGETFFEIELEHEEDEFSYNCEIESDLTDGSQNVIINNVVPNIELENPELKTGSFDLTLNCQSSQATTSAIKTIQLESTQKTIQTLPDPVIVENTNDFGVPVLNLLNDRTTVRASVSSSLQEFISIEDGSTILAANEERNVYFQVDDETFNKINTSVSGEITLQAGNYSTTVPVTIPSEMEAGLGWFTWILIIFGILIVAFGILVVIRYIQLQREDDDDDENEDEGEEEIIFDE